MIMRMTGARKMSITKELEMRKNFYTEEKQYARLRKRDFIFLPLMIATAIFLFFFLFLCINYVRELHKVSPTGDHLPRFLYRDSRSTLVKLNATIFDNLPHEYCHQPDKSNVGLEGFAPSGFALQQVHIFTSQGETTDSVSEITTTHSNEIFCEKMDCKFKTSDELHPKLKSFRDKIEKSRDDRFIRHFLPNFLKDEQCDQQLTPFGIQRLIILGEFLRDVYLKDLNLEKSKIQPKHIKAFNNGEDKIVKSSLAFLYGFLSDDHLSKLKITTLSTNLCSENSKAANVNCDCPSLLNEEKKFRAKLLSGGRSSKGDNTHMSQRLSKGDNLHTFPLVLQQALSVICSNPNISCFAQNVEIIEKILKDFNVFYQKISKDIVFVDFIHIYLYPIFYNLIHNFRRADYIFEKLFLYSVDDHILFYMLNVLKIPLKSWPRPGSRIVFELYKKTTQKFQQFYIRILYNGANVSHNVSLCNINMEQGFCRLKNFADLLKYRTSQDLDLKSAYQLNC